jgi:hypothetical protein
MASRTLAATAIAAMLIGVPVASRGADDANRPVRARADCSTRSEANFPGAFTNANNLVVGPLALVGAGGDTSEKTIRRFGGNKFPALVKAGHTVTLALPATVWANAALAYGPLPQGELRLRDGHHAVTFAACRADQPSGSSADGPVTFWSGGILAARPSCVPLDVFVDDQPAPQRVWLSLGRQCGAA